MVERRPSSFPRGFDSSRPLQFSSPGMPGFAAGRITALAAFLFEVIMFDIDFRGMIITLILVGALIGGAIVALMLLVWPWLWAMAKPTLHAWTV